MLSTLFLKVMENMKNKLKYQRLVPVAATYTIVTVGQTPPPLSGPNNQY